jgi:hypothetical protein
MVFSFELILSVFLCDLLWNVVVYGAAYKMGCVLLLNEYSAILKVLCDSEVRFYHYDVETGPRAHHEAMHLMASAVTFVLLSISPVLYSVVFAMQNFVDIIQVNRIALLVLTLDIMRYVCPEKARMSVSPLVVLNLFSQLLLLGANYGNTAVLIPMVFHLWDCAFEVVGFARRLDAVHRSLLESNTVLGGILRDFLLRAVSRAAALRRVRLYTLGCILVYAVYRATFEAWGELLFFYYGTYRVSVLYYNIDSVGN